MSKFLEVMFRYFVPASCLTDAESRRHARLLTGFGILGALFGFCYSVFYVSIGHHLGASVIILCSAGVMLIPVLLRRGVSLHVLGHAYTAILVAGFTALCSIEGGLHGHAIAWLVSVPLLALLLIGLDAAKFWGVVGVSAALVILGAPFVGVHFPETCPAEWIDVVTAAGYFGLFLFMLVFGILFESGRRSAAEQMEVALKALSSANERLTQLNAEKNEFLGIAAHDLKNPLTVIMGMSELLMSGEVPPGKIERFTGKINSEANRMRDLIANLLDLNAIEEGRMNLKEEMLELEELTRRAVENFKEVAGRKDTFIHFSRRAGSTRVKADGRAVLQVLDNLISNAIKYSPPSSVVHVELAELDRNLTVEVRDSGPGISPEDQKKLFQKFTKLTARPTAGESSNGLGLSIVKRLAEAMGGRVECESELGIGTSFILHLPAVQSSAKGRSVDASSSNGRAREAPVVPSRDTLPAVAGGH